MRHVDMRKLPAAAQEKRRRQVVGLQGHVGAPSDTWYGGVPGADAPNRYDIMVDFVRVYEWHG